MLLLGGGANMPATKTAFGVISLELPTGRMATMTVTPTRDQREIATMLKLDAPDLAKRIAANSANGITAGEYVSMNVRDMPLIAAHSRSESYPPIPAGIATSPKTLTSDVRCWLDVTTTCGSIAP